MTTIAKTRPSKTLTLKDRLAHLTYLEACKVIGPRGKELIQKNANEWDFDLDADVHLGKDFFRLRFPDSSDAYKPTIVTLTLMAEERNRLHWECNHCHNACDHVGAAFSLILEEKFSLGLSAAPPERAPTDEFSDATLIDAAIAERAERAKTEPMAVQAADRAKPWTDYTVTNRASGKSYRVALRGLKPGDSYCSCPDFRTNTLGTCKHILHVINKTKRRFSADDLKRPYVRKRLALHLRYADDVTLRLLTPAKMSDEVAAIVRPIADCAIEDMHDLTKRLGKLQRLGSEVTVFPDAEEFIAQRLFSDRIASLTAEIRKDPAKHPLRTSLLKIPLLPYQLDGVAFAAGAGRAILADDMGLGKTIQGVGTAELLAKSAGIAKVLVVCPASLKSQWRSEIRRFCDRSVQLVAGPNSQRASQYAGDSFFTVCNYEQVLRDILAIEPVKWDLIILDEGQRIKNWEAKTSNVIKSLRSRFALVLSGTPLENRLDELYSVVQFVDARRLGPGFRFFNKHRVVDDKGKVVGYKNLADLREALKPVLLRRTRDSVKLDLPPRTTEFVRIPPTDEQVELHVENMRVVSSIVRKKFLTEMDLLRLQGALLKCRMAADSSYLVDKQKPGHSTKLEYLAELFDRLFEEESRKVVLFSEWTTMLDLIQPLLEKRGLEYVRLDGSVPQKQRQELVQRFQTDATCKLFLTTNAGSTGLNLQAANTVINVDLPWNPAVLDQRIGRAHRMGQTQPVQVFVLITEQTIEENLLQTLGAKKDLALAALDTDSDVDQVDLVSGLSELKSRLEILLGAKPDAPLDETTLQTAKAEPKAIDAEQRERVAQAGGELFTAAFKFLGELVQTDNAPAPAEAMVEQLRNGLGACVEDDPNGKPRLTISLPDRSFLDGLAKSLATILAVSGANGSNGSTM